MIQLLWPVPHALRTINSHFSWRRNELPPQTCIQKHVNYTEVPYGSTNLCRHHALWNKHMLCSRAAEILLRCLSFLNALEEWSSLQSLWHERCFIPQNQNVMSPKQNCVTLAVSLFCFHLKSHFPLRLQASTIEINSVSRIWMEVNRPAAETGEGLYFDGMGHWFEWWKLSFKMGWSCCSVSLRTSGNKCEANDLY